MNYLLDNIESERLTFRRLQPADFPVWLQFFQDPSWNKYWKMQDCTPEENCQRWFDKAFYRYANNLGGMNVLIDKKSGEFVGQCGLLIQTVDKIQELEVGYSLLQKHWNKGYATEAAKRTIAYAFQNKLHDSLISIIHVNNVESARVALKNNLALDKQTIYDDNPVNVFRIVNFY